jgi:hypothetical protein
MDTVAGCLLYLLIVGVGLGSTVAVAAAAHRHLERLGWSGIVLLTVSISAGIIAMGGFWLFADIYWFARWAAMRLQHPRYHNGGV